MVPSSSPCRSYFEKYTPPLPLLRLKHATWRFTVFRKDSELQWFRSPNFVLSSPPQYYLTTFVLWQPLLNCVLHIAVMHGKLVLFYQLQFWEDHTGLCCQFSHAFLSHVQALCSQLFSPTRFSLSLWSSFAVLFPDERTRHESHPPQNAARKDDRSWLYPLQIVGGMVW